MIDPEGNFGGLSGTAHRASGPVNSPPKDIQEFLQKATLFVRDGKIQQTGTESKVETSDRRFSDHSQQTSDTSGETKQFTTSQEAAESNKRNHKHGSYKRYQREKGKAELKEIVRAYDKGCLGSYWTNGGRGCFDIFDHSSSDSFNADIHRRIPDPGRTLIMETIPRVHCKFWFVRTWYGRVDRGIPRVIVHERKGKALIEFSSTEAARRAFEATRFTSGMVRNIRLYWWRPEESAWESFDRQRAADATCALSSTSTQTTGNEPDAVCVDASGSAQSMDISTSSSTSFQGDVVVRDDTSPSLQTGSCSTSAQTTPSVETPALLTPEDEPFGPKPEIVRVVSTIEPIHSITLPNTLPTVHQKVTGTPHTPTISESSLDTPTPTKSTPTQRNFCRSKLGKWQQIERHIAETKALMAEFNSATTKDEKDRIRALLREKNRCACFALMNSSPNLKAVVTMKSRLSGALNLKQVVLRST